MNPTGTLRFIASLRMTGPIVWGNDRCHGHHDIIIDGERYCMRWLELTVETHPEAIESVSELLSQYARGGVAIEAPIELIDEGQEYRVLTGQPAKVHGYLPLDGTEEETR